MPILPEQYNEFVKAYNDPNVKITGGKGGFIDGFNDPKQKIPIQQPIRPAQNPNPNDPNSYGGWSTWSANNPGGTLDQFRNLIYLPKDNPNAIHGGTGLPYESKPIGQYPTKPIYPTKPMYPYNPYPTKPGYPYSPFRPKPVNNRSTYFSQVMIPTGVPGASYSDGSRTKVWYQGQLIPAIEFFKIYGKR